MKRISPAYVIGLILFIIPFFWFPPGAVDLGGDGNRLYFYDPVSFIKNVSLYSIDSEGKGNVEQRHAYLIYVGFIAIFKKLLGSPHTVIAFWNGIKLSIGFLSIYLIVREFAVSRVASVLAGLFYILSTGSDRLGFFWSKALHSHDQIFLNPLLFYLLLRYFITQRSLYLWGALSLSFIFSLDLSMNSAPPVFAFYPIAFTFLLVYVIFIRKKRIHVWKTLLGFVVFLGLSAFHLIPSLASLFTGGSVANSIVFKESVTGGVNYFMAVRGLGKVSISLFSSTIAAPLVIVLGFLLEQKKRRDVLLVSAFFLLTLFLVSANITNVGFAFYRTLFYIPGFSMFRNFSSQFAYVYLFFYALLFGLSLSVIFDRLKRASIPLAILLLGIVLCASYWQLLTGELIDRVQWGSDNVRSVFVMDPRFTETLEYIRSLPDEGKMLVIPVTDNFNQVIYGTNNAAYVGPSPISILTAKKTFAGYQNFYPNPIPETIMKLSREKNYRALNQIFSLFNIRYVFWNSDPRIYEEKFPNFPNGYMMTSMPKTQQEYREFLRQLPLTILYENGPFTIFEFSASVYRPEVYIPDTIYQGEFVDSVAKADVSFRSAFLSKDACPLCVAPGAEIATQKISPVSYKLTIRHDKTDAPFLLVFQNSYHKDWRLVLDGKTEIPDDQHISANTYANAWVITSRDRDGKTDYSAVLTLETQRYFYYGLAVTGIALIVAFRFVVHEISS